MSFDDFLLLLAQQTNLMWQVDFRPREHDEAFNLWNNERGIGIMFDDAADIWPEHQYTPSKIIIVPVNLSSDVSAWNAINTVQCEGPWVDRRKPMLNKINRMRREFVRG